jgi:hypothetical protein
MRFPAVGAPMSRSGGSLTVEIIYERVAAIDVGRKIIAVAVRTPGKRRQQARRYNTY